MLSSGDRPLEHRQPTISLEKRGPTFYPCECGMPCGLAHLQRVKSRIYQLEGGLSTEMQELLVGALLYSPP